MTIPQYDYDGEAMYGTIKGNSAPVQAALIYGRDNDERVCIKIPIADLVTLFKQYEFMMVEYKRFRPEE